jgi:KRAB domain-containing zinc finger protein
MKRSLVEHFRTHVGETGFVCHVCGKSLSTKISLQSHLQTHTGEKPYQCEKCNKGYTSKCSWVRHTKDCGKTSEERSIYGCPKCPMRLKTKDALKYHLNYIHSNPGSFVCPRCNKALNSRGALARHVCHAPE